MDHPPHLTQDQLMQALIDDTKLSSELREHLSACSSCKEKKEKLSNRFNDLKSLSNRISNRSKPWFSFSRGEPYAYSYRSFEIRFMFIIAGVIVLIFILNFYNPFGFKARDTKKQLNSYNPNFETVIESTSPLPEFYSGLVEFSDRKTPWWHKETYINGLKLTSDEVEKLESTWKNISNTFTKLEKAVLAEQVDLAIALEKQDFNKETVQRHYQRLWPNYTYLTEERFKFLLKIRTILGYERFQDLLRLHRY
jgi:hypothetical protein